MALHCPKLLKTYLQTNEVPYARKEETKTMHSENKGTQAMQNAPDTRVRSFMRFALGETNEDKK
jgi:hypothetical protein